MASEKFGGEAADRRQRTQVQPVQLDLGAGHGRAYRIEVSAVGTDTFRAQLERAAGLLTPESALLKYPEEQ